MNLDFEPISSLSEPDDILGVVELIAYFQGECFIDDLEWDDDQLLGSFLDSLTDPGAKTDYEIERNAGIQLAKDTVVRLVQERIEARHGNLGRASPFTWDFASELLLKRKISIVPAGFSYLWLSLFWALLSKNSYLVVKPDASAFLRAFDIVFEATCALVLAGRRESAVWYLGESRNARGLLKRLEKVVAFCASGQVKQYSNLTRAQRRSNDGGVDVLAVSTAGGLIAPDSEMYLLGATIQASRRSSKIVGTNQITRFRGYFLHAPNPHMAGVLAVPFPYSDLDAEHCAEQNCMYIAKDRVLAYLARPALGGDWRLRSAFRRILSETKTLAGAVTFRQ